MKFTIYFLLISSLSINIISALKVSDINGIIKNGNKNLLGKKDQILKLSEGGELNINNNSIVWKGTYSDKTVKNVKVAIKILSKQKSFVREMKILKVLNATDDPKIERLGIPRIYYHGEFHGDSYAIVMSLFDGTLSGRYKLQGGPLKDSSILMIFKRTVEILKYLNEKNVVHNDIKPENLFLRGSEVFISDFDQATSDGKQNMGNTAMWASSGYYGGKDRTAVDDLESLVFSMWYVAGVPVGRAFIGNEQPEGFILSESKKIGKAEARMHEKCDQIKNLVVREAFKFVCFHEILLSQKPVPHYDEIIKVFSEALSVVNKGSSKPVYFEWLAQDDITKSIEAMKKLSIHGQK